MDASLLSIIKFFGALIGLMIALYMVVGKYASVKFGERSNEMKSVCRATIDALKREVALMNGIIDQKLDNLLVESEKSKSEILVENEKSKSEILMKISENTKLININETEKAVAKEQSRELKEKILKEYYERKEHDKAMEARAKEHSGRIKDLEFRVKNK